MSQEKYKHNAVVCLNGPKGFHDGNVTKEMLTLKTDSVLRTEVFCILTLMFISKIPRMPMAS